jgi:hypothetical protein
MTDPTLSEHQRQAARKRWAKTSKKDRAKTAKRASRAYWDAMTPEERSAEMKRRAAKRAHNRKARGK